MGASIAGGGEGGEIARGFGEKGGGSPAPGGRGRRKRAQKSTSIESKSTSMEKIESSLQKSTLDDLPDGAGLEGQP